MRRRHALIPALLVLTVTACDDDGLTVPERAEVVFSEQELAQVADLNSYIDMIRSGVDPTSDEARALNERIMERYPAPEAMEAALRPDDGPSSASGPVPEAVASAGGDPVVVPPDRSLRVGSGPSGEIVVPEDVGTIYDAVVSAAPGSTIIVRPGVYYERFWLTGLSDLTILGVGAEVRGSLQLDGDDLVVAGFAFTYDRFGLLLRFGSGHVALANRFTSYGQGLTMVTSLGGFVAGNITAGSNLGILLLGADDYGIAGADNNLIAGNLATGGFIGYLLETKPGSYVRNLALIGNAAQDNYLGFYFWYTEDTTFAYNIGICNAYLLDGAGEYPTDIGNFETCPSS